MVAERDGHDFVAAAVAAGAAAYLTPRGPAAGGHRRSWSPTPRRPCGDIGRHRPRPAAGRAVVGITGSVGKTSVKDLLAAVLARRWRTAASRGRSTTSSACRSPCSTRPTTPRRWSSRWAPGASATSPSCARSPGRPSASSPGWPPPTPSCSARSTRWRGPRASWSRRCPPAGTAVLNADDRGWRPWPARTAATVRHLRRAAATSRAEAVALDDELRPSLPLRRRGASAEVAPRGARRAPGRQRPGRGRRARWRRRRRSTASPTAWRRAALSPWRMELAGCRPGAVVAQRRLQRQPDVDGGRARRAGRAAGPAPGRRARRDGRAGRRERGRAPGGRHAGRRARHRRSSAVGAPAYGGTTVGRRRRGRRGARAASATATPCWSRAAGSRASSV